MARSFLLVHSPLIGPSSLRRLADLVAAEGAEVALPDLTPMASADHPHEAYARRAIAAAADLTPPVTVIGHSGAGPFLPAIRAAVGAPAVLVFVDAVVPPRSGAYRTPEALHEMLDRHTDDGKLRPWLDWWPPELVAELLPDPGDREQLAADMPRLPCTFYEHDVAVPSGWSEQPCAYVRLSAAYDADHAEAIARGWPTRRLAATHLATHTQPVDVLAAIRDLVGRPP